MYFFFDLYNVGKYKKKNNFEHVLYPQFIKSEEKKIIQKNGQQQEDHSQTIKKNRFKGDYTDLYF